MEERVVGLKLTRDKEKYWLHFNDGEGRHASINIEVLEGAGSVVGKCIRKWAEEQFLIGR